MGAPHDEVKMLPKKARQGFFSMAADASMLVGARNILTFIILLLAGSPALAQTVRYEVSPAGCEAERNEPRSVGVCRRQEGQSVADLHGDTLFERPSRGQRSRSALSARDQRPDPDIARDAIAAIKSEFPLSLEAIKVVVRDGWVTLEGEVEWQYHKKIAENAVRGVRDVKGAANMIALKPRAEPTDIWNKIQEALKRNAEVDDNRVIVETNGSEVI
jgi:osmotically-inducible protein OsmY